MPVTSKFACEILASRGRAIQGYFTKETEKGMTTTVWDTNPQVVWTSLCMSVIANCALCETPWKSRRAMCTAASVTDRRKDGGWMVTFQKKI